MSIDPNKGYVRVPKNQNENVVIEYAYINECNLVLEYLLNGTNKNNGIWFFQDISEAFPLISDAVLDNVVFPKLKIDGFISILNGNSAPSSKTRVQFKLSDEGKLFLSGGGYQTDPQKTLNDFIPEFLQYLSSFSQSVDVTDFVTTFYKQYHIERTQIKFKIDELIRRKYIRCLNYEYLGTNLEPFPQPQITATITLEGEQYLRVLVSQAKDTPSKNWGVGHKPL